MKSLAESVRVLQGRELTAEENESLTKFQKIYGIGDDDPLVVILAMIGVNRILLESVPELFHQRVLETIKLHQQTLREQSTLIAKELIMTLSDNIKAAGGLNSLKDQFIEYFLIFLVGGLTGGALVVRLLG